MPILTLKNSDLLRLVMLLIISTSANCSTSSVDQLKLYHCSQSSVAAGGSCNYATDGKTETMWGRNGNICAYTDWQDRPYWQAATATFSNISRVLIYNRIDSHPKRLNNFVIKVDGHVCAEYKTSSYFSSMNFTCNRVGQMIRIESRKATHLTLCEVQVFGTEVKQPSLGNQLKLDHCSQSSENSGGKCNYAIDGNLETFWGVDHNKCAQTNADKRPYWQAATKTLSRITHVRLFNRLDFIPERLSNLVIKVDGVECARYNDSKGYFSVKLFECNRIGSVIRIESKKATYLTVCEVQVFGSVVTRHSLGDQLKLAHCLQSSTSHKGECKFAFDGITNQFWGKKGNKCAHTKWQSKPFWQATTATESNITYIRIYNRLDYASHGLNNFVIKVDGLECASYRSNTHFSVKNFKCNRVGSVIRIESKFEKKTHLTLCEVQVFGTDMAQKPSKNQLKLDHCSQSSESFGGKCNNAIDGKTEMFWGKGGKICTCTKRQKRPYWQAATKTLSRISHVRIFNRLDAYSDRLNNFVIKADGHVCAEYRSNTYFSVKLFKCNKVGRVIRIESRKKTYLTLCQVQVFGTAEVLESHYDKLKLIDCSQSSVESGGECKFAMDGVKAQFLHSKSTNKCAQTKYESIPFWQATLKAKSEIQEIIIYNRADKYSNGLNDFVIKVDGKQCASYKSSSHFSMKKFTCGQYGRDIRIENRSGASRILSLCEVEVYGFEGRYMYKNDYNHH